MWNTGHYYFIWGIFLNVIAETGEELSGIFQGTLLSFIHKDLFSLQFINRKFRAKFVSHILQLYSTSEIHGVYIQSTWG